MPNDDLYSVRMRASRCGEHLSGAERIIDVQNVKAVVDALLDRSFTKSHTPDRITINIEGFHNSAVHHNAALDVRTVLAPDMLAGRALAKDMLVHVGVSTLAATRAIDLLDKGPAPGNKNMRGAVIMDADKGTRSEPDQERGVRASRFDWTEQALQQADACLTKAGLFHHRTREALALATKIAHAPGVVAELCWSDDPDYTAGYVASLRSGYVRFPFLKQTGVAKGGRVIFVDHTSLDLDRLIAYLQNEPMLITSMDNAPREVRSDAGIDSMLQR